MSKKPAFSIACGFGREILYCSCEMGLFIRPSDNTFHRPAAHWGIYGQYIIPRADFQHEMQWDDLIPYHRIPPSPAAPAPSLANPSILGYTIVTSDWQELPSLKCLRFPGLYMISMKIAERFWRCPVGTVWRGYAVKFNSTIISETFPLTVRQSQRSTVWWRNSPLG